MTNDGDAPAAAAPSSWNMVTNIKTGMTARIMPTNGFPCGDTWPVIFQPSEFDCQLSAAS